MKTRPSRYYLFLVILITAALGFGLALSTRYINFWPTDSYSHYLPAARNLFDLPHLSDMHFAFPDFASQLKVHGKEVLILGIAIMQRILHDPQSLYPNVLLVIIAVSVASIFMYLVMRKSFDDQTAWLAFFLLAGCFWPYQWK